MIYIPFISLFILSHMTTMAHSTIIIAGFILTVITQIVICTTFAIPKNFPTFTYYPFRLQSFLL